MLICRDRLSIPTTGIIKPGKLEPAHRGMPAIHSINLLFQLKCLFQLAFGNVIIAEHTVHTGDVVDGARLSIGRHKSSYSSRASANEATSGSGIITLTLQSQTSVGVPLKFANIQWVDATR